MKSASWRTIAFRSASISLFRKGVPLFPRQKGKKLRAAFEDGKLDASQIKSILSGGGLSTSKQPGRRVSVTLPPAFAPYFPPKATTKQNRRNHTKKPWLCISRPWEMLHSPVKANRLGTPIDRECRVFLFTFYRRRLPMSKESLSLCPRPI